MVMTAPVVSLRLGIAILCLVVTADGVGVGEEGETAGFVREALKQDAVVVFDSSEGSGLAVKILKEELAVPPRVYYVEKLEVGVLQALKESITGLEVLPQVFLNGNFIGSEKEASETFNHLTLQYRVF